MDSMTDRKTALTAPWLTIVGLGEDGLDGLGARARQAIAAATIVVGGERHLRLVPEQAGQQRLSWPSPFSKGIDMVLEMRGRPVCILATGDPMHYGVGATLSHRIPLEEMLILPASSAFSLAASRLGWALQDCVCLSVHGRPLELVHPHLHPGAKLLILSDGGHTPKLLAELLTQRHFGASRLAVLEHMGSPSECRQDGSAATWHHPDSADMNVVAIDCAGHGGLCALAGLPESAYLHDGQLTKRDVRAATLARLAPEPGHLLWDVGAGCGSIGIEWMRAHPRCRAVAVEANVDRQALIERNKLALGVPGLIVVAGHAPEALQGLEQPDAIFIGGGLTALDVPKICWEALKPGGRLVVNAVTVESQTLAMALHKTWGGELCQIAVSHPEPLGQFTIWRAALPVVIFTAVKT